jgi:hypothetical protein
LRRTHRSPGWRPRPLAGAPGPESSFLRCTRSWRPAKSRRMDRCSTPFPSPDESPLAAVGCPPASLGCHCPFLAFLVRLGPGLGIALSMLVGCGGRGWIGA